MNNFAISSSTEALAWTLLNSVWQGMLIMLLLIVTLRFVSNQHSQARYLISCGAVVLLAILNISTFVYLKQAQSNESVTVVFELAGSRIADAAQRDSIESGFLRWQNIVDKNIPLLIYAWLIGTILFSLRMLTGWWYVSRLRSQAEILNDEWSERISLLAEKLNITKTILLAQSSRVASPVVIGFINPVILIPVGMFSGLSTKEIEAIFLHELAHIRRHDYIVNLIQSIVESVYFFNPFVWVMSGIIRREREYCCDDAVVMKSGNAVTYAHALAKLEEARISNSFVLSIAENKNQLLYRIKRIMEKSVKNYSGKDRVLPVVLLVIGLVCASWLTIRNENYSGMTTDNILLQDTAKRKNKAKPIQKDPDKQGLKKIPGPADEARESWEAIPFTEESVAFPRYAEEDERWKEFRAEFEMKFREKFKDFYKNNEKDFEKLMKEMDEKFAKEYTLSLKFPGHPDVFMYDLKVKADADYFRSLEEEALRDQEIALEHLEDIAHITELEHLKELEHLSALDHLKEIEIPQLDEMAHVMDMRALELSQLSDNLKEMEFQMKKFEKELKSELVKDGYLEKVDEVNTIDWSDEGLKVNGKKIKDQHTEKYRKLHDSYFKGRGVNIVE